LTCLNLLSNRIGGMSIFVVVGMGCVGVGVWNVDSGGGVQYHGNPHGLAVWMVVWMWAVVLMFFQREQHGRLSFS
jgi:hypothetical protein